MKSILTGVALAAALAVGASTIAEARPGGVQVGTLSCRQHQGFGMIIGSSRRISCVYQGPDGSSRYDGSITDLGVDVGYHGPSELVWAVFAPTDRLGPGALRGHFAGATAGGSVVVGVSANALVGGSDRSIQLQPLSVSGNTGLDVAAGVAGMSLYPVHGSYEPG